jgi:hypothetical protein
MNGKKFHTRSFHTFHTARTNGTYRVLDRSNIDTHCAALLESGDPSIDAARNSYLQRGAATPS